jgi:hypothetical protein
MATKRRRTSKMRMRMTWGATNSYRKYVARKLGKIQIICYFKVFPKMYYCDIDGSEVPLQHPVPLP